MAKTLDKSHFENERDQLTVDIAKLNDELKVLIKEANDYGEKFNAKHQELREMIGKKTIFKEKTEETLKNFE